MPTARQVSVTKRQKLHDENEELSASIQTQSCVTFETLIDRDYPTNIISENLLRTLNYESLQGVGELLALLVRCSGSNAEFTIVADANDTDVGAIKDNIVASCLASTEGCPAVYPLQKVEFARRLTQVLGTVTTALFEAGNHDVLSYACRLVASMTLVAVQSIRHVATAFAGIMADAVDADDFGDQNLLVNSLVSRTSDVAPLIRRRAVQDLASARPLEVVRALNDGHNSVRLAALRSLSLDEIEAVVNGPTTTSTDTKSSLHHRIEQMAVEDVDLFVRRAALKLMQNSRLEVSDTAKMAHLLRDDDDQSRKLAAELIVRKEARSVDSASLFLLSIAGFATNRLASPALAHGLDRAKSKFSNVSLVKQIAIVLTSDYDKESRRPKLDAATKREYKVLAKELSSQNVRSQLTSLLDAVLVNQKSKAAVLLSYIPSLISRAQYSDKVLSRTLTALSKLPFESFMGRSESEKLSANAFELFCDLFLNRSNDRSVYEGLSMVFACIPATHRSRLLSDVYQDLRIKIAGILGSSGVPGRGKEPQLETTTVQLIVVGRFVDISDLTRLPLWRAVSEGNPHVLQLVRAIGMKGDAQIVKLVISHLTDRASGPAVDDILRLFVSAKMRGVDLDMPLPIDVNETAPTSESTWRAAVAACVV